MEKVSNFTSGVVSNLTPKAVERINLRPQIVTWDIPPPHPAAPGPTTDELHMAKQLEKSKLATQQNEQLLAGKEDLTGEGKAAGQRAKGLWNVVKNFTNRTYTEASAVTNHLLRDKATNKDVNNFLDEFPDVANSGAVHISAHSCKTSHSNLWESCNVHVTSTHLCVEGEAFVDALPLKSIASIIPSVDLPTSDSSPLLVETPDPRVVVKGVQVYTTSKKCYLFSRFTVNMRHKVGNQNVNDQMSPVFQFFVNLDRAWRAEQKIPHPDVQYAKLKTGIRTEIVEPELPAPTSPVAPTAPVATSTEQQRSVEQSEPATEDSPLAADDGTEE